jgi:AraC-like DNA-binding protein
MKGTTIHIKSMVCGRCIRAVEEILQKTGISYFKVSLGEAEIQEQLSLETKSKFEKMLQESGFELLEYGKSVLVSKVKTMVIKQIHHSNEPLKVNFSDYLSENLHHEYSYLSHLFSSVEGITIEKFIIRQKIERVKEMLFYNELNLTEIAHLLDYSSVAHLSSQFRKETGMTTSQFRQLGKPGHKSLDGGLP